MAANRTRYVFDAQTLARLDACCEVLSPEPIEDFSTPSARSLLGQAEILVTGWGCPSISAEVVAASPQLRLIAHAAGTVKNIASSAVYDAGIIVTQAADANAIPVAEYTLAAIIFANKRVFELRDLYRADPSRRLSGALLDEPIGNYRRTVGLIGASRIGRKVAAFLKALDYDVLLSDPYLPADDPLAKQVEVVDLPTLMSRSDIVSVHAPLLPSTIGMLGAAQLALMRDGATLINTARGAIVDEAALLTELVSGRIQAVIDVTDPEIPPPGSPFYTLPNVFLTPHVAGAAGTERLRLGQLAASEVERYVRRQPLHFAIDPAILERQA